MKRRTRILTIVLLVTGIMLIAALVLAYAFFVPDEEGGQPIAHIASEVQRRFNCESNTEPVFTHHITDITAVNDVQMPPRFVGEFLKTHSYIGTGDIRVPIYAPTDMILSSGTLYADPGHPENYMLDFNVSCEIRVRYDHVTEPVESIVNQFPLEAQPTSQTIPVKERISFAAGEVIGYTTRSQHGNWDFGVYDNTHTNVFASDPEFDHSETYTTAVCPFDFFTPELQQAYYDKRIERGGDDQRVLESFCN